MMPRPRHPQALTGLLCALIGAGALVGCDNTAGDYDTTEPAPTTTTTPRTGTTADTTTPAANLTDGDDATADGQAGSQMQTKEVDLGSSKSDEGLVVERMMPDQVYANSQTQYTLRVRNDGELIFHNVVVHEALSNNFTPQQQGRSAGQNQGQRPGQGQQSAAMAQMTELMHDVGILGPGESRDITVYGTATGEGQVEACTWVTYNAAACQTFNIVKPELAMDHRFVNAEGREVREAYACDEVYLMYSVTNTGSGETPAITINETLPQGVMLADASGPIKVDAGTLGAGEKFESDKMKLNLEDSDVDDIRARAIANADKLGEVADGSSLTILRPALAMTIQAPSEEYLGRDVRVGVTVENTSDAPARDVMVDMPLPEGAQNLSVSDGRITREDDSFMIGELAAGASRSFDVRFRVDEPGDVSEEAVAKAYCAPEVRKPLNIAFVGIPALQLEVIDSTDPVRVGETTVYNIKVLNEGTAEDLNVRITGTLPEGFSFVSSEGQPKATASGRNLTFDPIARLAPGEEAEINVTAKADSAVRGKFELKIQSDKLGQTLTEDESTTSN